MDEESPKYTADRDKTTEDLSNKDRLVTECPQISFEDVQQPNLDRRARKKVVHLLDKQRNYDDSYAHGAMPGGNEKRERRNNKFRLRTKRRLQKPQKLQMSVATDNGNSDYAERKPQLEVDLSFGEEIEGEEREDASRGSALSRSLEQVTLQSVRQRSKQSRQRYSQTINVKERKGIQFLQNSDDDVVNIGAKEMTAESNELPSKSESSYYSAARRLPSNSEDILNKMEEASKLILNMKQFSKQIKHIVVESKNNQRQPRQRQYHSGHPLKLPDVQTSLHARLNEQDLPMNRSIHSRQGKWAVQPPQDDLLKAALENSWFQPKDLIPGNSSWFLPKQQIGQHFAESRSDHPAPRQFQTLEVASDQQLVLPDIRRSVNLNDESVDILSARAAFPSLRHSHIQDDFISQILEDAAKNIGFHEKKKALKRKTQSLSSEQTQIVEKEQASKQFENQEPQVKHIRMLNNRTTQEGAGARLGQVRLGSVTIDQDTGTVSRSSNRLSSQSEMRRHLTKSVAITAHRLRENVKNQKIKVSADETKFVLFSDQEADHEQQSRKYKHKKYKRLKNYGDQPPSLELSMQSESSISPQADPHLKQKVDRKLVEQGLLYQGVKQPQATLSFFTDSQMVKDIMERAHSFLNWHLYVPQQAVGEDGATPLGQPQTRSKRTFNENLVDLLLGSRQLFEMQTDNEWVAAPGQPARAKKGIKQDNQLKIKRQRLFQNWIDDIEQSMPNVSKCLETKSIQANSALYLQVRPRFLDLNELNFTSSQPLDNLIVFRQFLYIRRLHPLKAYALKYKFFESSNPFGPGRSLFTEGDLCQYLVKEQDIALNIGSKFNKKVEQVIQDVLQVFQRDYLNKSQDQSSPIQFQILDLKFAINIETGLPDFLGLDPAPFTGDEESTAALPQEQAESQKLNQDEAQLVKLPESFKQCFISLFVKLDRQVRKFNGMPFHNASQKMYKQEIFTKFWHKLVDVDETDDEVRYDHKIKTNQKNAKPRELALLSSPEAGKSLDLEKKASNSSLETVLDCNILHPDNVQDEMALRSQKLPSPAKSYSLKFDDLKDSVNTFDSPNKEDSLIIKQRLKDQENLSSHFLSKQKKILLSAVNTEKNTIMTPPQTSSNWRIRPGLNKIQVNDGPTIKVMDRKKEDSKQGSDSNDGRMPESKNAQAFPDLDEYQLAKVVQIQAFFRMKYAVESFEYKRFLVMRLQWIRRKYKEERDRGRRRHLNFQLIRRLKEVVDSVQCCFKEEAMEQIKAHPAFLEEERRKEEEERVKQEMLMQLQTAVESNMRQVGKKIKKRKAEKAVKDRVAANIGSLIKEKETLVKTAKIKNQIANTVTNVMKLKNEEIKFQKEKFMKEQEIKDQMQGQFANLMNEKETEIKKKREAELAQSKLIKAANKGKIDNMIDTELKEKNLIKKEKSDDKDEEGATIQKAQTRSPKRTKPTRSSRNQLKNNKQTDGQEKQSLKKEKSPRNESKTEKAKKSKSPKNTKKQKKSASKSPKNKSNQNSKKDLKLNGDLPSSSMAQQDAKKKKRLKITDPLLSTQRLKEGKTHDKWYGAGQDSKGKGQDQKFSINLNLNDAIQKIGTLKISPDNASQQRVVQTDQQQQDVIYDSEINETTVNIQVKIQGPSPKRALPKKSSRLIETIESNVGIFEEGMKQELDILDKKSIDKNKLDIDSAQKDQDQQQILETTPAISVHDASGDKLESAELDNQRLASEPDQIKSKGQLDNVSPKQQIEDLLKVGPGTIANQTIGGASSFIPQQSITDSFFDSQREIVQDGHDNHSVIGIQRTPVQEEEAHQADLAQQFQQIVIPRNPVVPISTFSSVEQSFEPVQPFIQDTIGSSEFQAQMVRSQPNQFIAVYDKNQRISEDSQEYREDQSSVAHIQKERFLRTVQADATVAKDGFDAVHSIESQKTQPVLKDEHQVQEQQKHSKTMVDGEIKQPPNKTVIGQITLDPAALSSQQQTQQTHHELASALENESLKLIKLDPIYQVKVESKKPEAEKAAKKQQPKQSKEEEKPLKNYLKRKPSKPRFFPMKPRAVKRKNVNLNNGLFLPGGINIPLLDTSGIRDFVNTTSKENSSRRRASQPQRSQERKASVATTQLNEDLNVIMNDIQNERQVDANRDSVIGSGLSKASVPKLKRPTALQKSVDQKDLPSIKDQYIFFRL